MIILAFISLLIIFLLLVLSKEVELSQIVYIICAGGIVLSSGLSLGWVSVRVISVTLFLLFIVLQLFEFLWRNKCDKS